MPEKHTLRLMQEAIDGELSQDAERELSLLLEENPEEAVQYDRLQQVDALLSSAPRERAPERLAVTIMARLSQVAKPHAKTKTQSAITEEMLQTAVQLVTVAALPMLVSAGWMLLNAQSDPEMLEVVLYHVAALLMITLDVMQVIMEKAQEVFPTDPELAMALLTLMPSVLLALVYEVLNIHDTDDPDQPL